MKWEIVCAGIGGRGVLLASAVLIEAATEPPLWLMPSSSDPMA